MRLSRTFETMLLLSACLAPAWGADAPVRAEAPAAQPLWTVCAHALDEGSHPNIDQLTDMIESGKLSTAALVTALKNRGCIHEFLADDEAAIADYAKALELAPDDAEAHFVRGRVYDKTHRPTEALADYDAALRLAPNDATTYLRRGHIYEDGLHEHQKAVDDYTASIRLDPDNSAAYRLRAIAYANIRRRPEAALDLATAQRLDLAAPPRENKRAAGEDE